MDDQTIRPVQWKGNALALLDQRRLPHEAVYLLCATHAEVGEAIRTMAVRGAPAIGVAAGFGMALAVLESFQATGDPGGASALRATISEAALLLRSSRPTAVNLGWAIDRMVRRFEELVGAGPVPDDLAAAMVAEAEAIFREDLAANHRIGAYGAALLAQSTTVLTHCNAGALATSGYGTALGVIRAAREAGKSIAVFAGETRPWLQGARLTAWELQQEGFDVTLITDNMAGHFFQKKTFDAVIVGADRIAANGDTANKIGTYTLAVLAAAHGVPFYVAAPLSTIDLLCPDGSAIPIEERSAIEVTETQGWDSAGAQHRLRNAPAGVAARHPAFDVTPAKLITSIITDRGVALAPFGEAIAELMKGDRDLG